MHRTVSIDLALVISGEGDLAYPGEDGELKEIHLRQGDFIVPNGAFHGWRNRSGAHLVVYIVTFGAERQAA
jgi:oxalate decarboxylase/phosphoglucose isomerase-like protein (cupin superfamily)